MAEKDNIISIDGSTLEGGGQILRNSVSLAAILNKSLHIHNIRAGRSKPGLGNQHLAGINLANAISNGTLSRCKVGSQEIEFQPHNIQGGSYTAQVGTAGSVCLLAQVAVPILMFCKESTLRLSGGTNADMAPPIDFYQQIFSHYIKMMGMSLDVKIVKRGFYPKGGGIAEMTVNCMSSPLSPINLIDRGEIVRIKLYSYVAGTLPKKLAYEMQQAAEKLLKTHLQQVPIESTVEQIDSTQSFGNGSGIMLTAETSTGCLISSSQNGKPRISPSQTGTDTADELLQDLHHNCCVDCHMQDQLIIFMALASGKSIIRTGPVTLHTKTAIFIAEQLTNVQFTITEDSTLKDTFLIECIGIGFKIE